MKVMVIKVFKTNISEKVIATFNSKEELYKANKIHNWDADQITIDGLLMYGWDEIESYPYLIF